VERHIRFGSGPETGRRPAEDETAPPAAIKIFYTNAQSIKSKINELRAVTADERPDVILLSETWCNGEIGNGELELDGYQLETDCRRDRTDTTNGIGGGLLAYSKSGLATRTITRFNDNKFNQFCAFKLLTTKPLNIILLYRPPNSGMDNIDELCKLKQHGWGFNYNRRFQLSGD
jgi:exonuclease III